MPKKTMINKEIPYIYYKCIAKLLEKNRSLCTTVIFVRYKYFFENHMT